MDESTAALIARIDEDLKSAMRARDDVAKLTLRAVKTALTEMAKGADGDHELTQDEVMAVIQREAKRRRDAAAEYEKAGRADRAAEELAELAVLERYLPRQLSEAEIHALAVDVIAEVGASSMRDMGAVMTAIKPRTDGLADGREVNRIVRALLA